MGPMGKELDLVKVKGAKNSPAGVALCTHRLVCHTSRCVHNATPHKNLGLRASRIAWAFLLAFSMKNIGHTIGAVSRGLSDGTNGEGAGSGEGVGSEEISWRSSIMHRP